MTILILGDGLLGNEFYIQTGWNYISRKKHKINFIDITSYSYYLIKLNITHVINCIANTNNNVNSDDKNDWLINYKGVMDLVDFCNDRNIKLIHISTDYVYANSKKLASEKDIPIHYNSYTYTKLLADSYIYERSKNYLIMRSSFKPRPFPYNSAWIDFIGNFDYVDVITTLMIKLIKNDANGIYNVGTQIKTMYDLAKITNGEIKPKYKEKQFIESNDVSMNIEKMEKFLITRD